jgi:serine/threonine protein kinase
VVLIPRYRSGAFSNVYKAQDLSTGQKVASTKESHHHLCLLTFVPSTVKVVRKYELSSQQVSVSRPICSFRPYINGAPPVLDRPETSTSTLSLRKSREPLRCYSSLLRIYFTLSDPCARFDSDPEYTAREHPQRQAWTPFLYLAPPPDVQSEVQIMRGTDHPSIVKLYAFSESAEYYYLVLECQCFLLSRCHSVP